MPRLAVALLALLVLPAAISADPLQAGQAPAPDGTVHGRVVDTSGGAIVGAKVEIVAERTGATVSGVTDQDGAYTLPVAAGGRIVRVSAEGFDDASRRIAVGAGVTLQADFTLRVAGIQETVSVGGAAPSYAVPEVSSATRTPTPLRDIPQAVSVVSRTLIAEQRMTSMADVARYMPGVGFAQGEGNRDTPVLRGNSTTADFFVDGVRDDVQYFRDVYNVDRVEALKGPNAMIFGRGGGGGVINRVTRQAEWGQEQEVSVQLGSWDNRRLSADVGRGLSDTVAVRATAMYEDSESYRDGVSLERFGINPTVAFRLSPATTVRAGYEFFSDTRTADRGISSWQGRPVDTAPSTFFGDPSRSTSDATVHLASAVIEHRLRPAVLLRSRTTFGAYDKFYANVFPGAVNAAGTTVALSAYDNATTRQNVFNQTDAVITARTGRLRHTILAGAEFGRQDTDNLRRTGYFTSIGANVTSVQAPLASPTTSLPIEFRQSATDADNTGVTTIAAAFAQDQVAFSDQLSAVVGLRVDSFRVRATNLRSNQEFRSDDGLVSPRLGLVYKPIQPLSVYGSYSLTYLPRAGEQLASLSISNQALDPEEFRNYEVGAKWDLTRRLSFTTAVYRLDRGNVAVPDPLDPTQSILVDAQRSRGVEVEVNGYLTRAWSVAGGYAWQQGEITRSISATAQAGASLAHLPRHSISLWNRVTLTSRLSAALGVLYRDDMYAGTDNTVVLPSWTRVDAAVFYDLTRAVRLQANLENLTNERYAISAHNNTNITPGSPRALRVALTTRF
ncbi:TonB-dependent siderophore receptor [Luteitalea sp. TBR-22]|uniref:TonB-dependent siderophore receptor n=1 Tax=Luteitalea sp. TBR-22 TaxID=2802971 RepID=UPI001EF71206|nr:TonB-dependent siderophore receptor [Luteitalea sp. TBR-22]